ncbi:hypothetical protein BJ165DRAFT_1404743 [Panaeolus papilionaceus]|nr:hypothetical protein BJ165DRAFT_1404743 [Panaeolus papilionaceus]
MASDSTSGPYTLIPLPEGTITQTLDEDLKGLMAIDMSMIHNVFIRSMNSIYVNAPKVAPKDVPAFAGYCITALDTIESHHHGEETYVFPVLEKKIEEIKHNVDQHKAFHDGMDTFRQYMLDLKSKKESYDGVKVQELCKAFADPLVQHLHDEIPTISPEKLARFDDEPETLKKMFDKLEEHIKSQPGKLTVFPFVMTHHDFEKAPNWPPVPAPIKWFARNVAPHWNSSYWKFSPYTPKGASQTYTPAIKV